MACKCGKNKDCKCSELLYISNPIKVIVKIINIVIEIYGLAFMGQKETINCKKLKKKF